MNKFICRVSYCNYPEGQCLEGCDQIYPLMRMLEPPTEQPAEQQPLTREEIFEIAEPFGEFKYGDAQGHKRIEFARAIERAHGIGEQE